MKHSDLTRALDHAIDVLALRSEELESREKTQRRNKLTGLADVTDRQWKTNMAHAGTLRRYRRGLEKIWS